MTAINSSSAPRTGASVHGCTAFLRLVGIAVLCTAAMADGHASTEAVASVLDDADLYEQRMAYRRASFAARTGRRSEYTQALVDLADYPLRPYLVFYDARRRASGLRAKHVHELRTQFSGMPLEDRFYRHWLNTQARHGRWKTYAENYEPTPDVVARCHYLRALIITGRREEAYQQIPGLWVSPRSQPDECDPAFQSWINAGRLNQETAWTRLLLALGENEVTLARYLLRFFDRANASAARLTYDAHVRPQLVRSLSRFANDELGRRALAHAIVRYAKRDAEKALIVWQKARDSYDFQPSKREHVQSLVMAEVANAGLIPQDGPIGYAPALLERVAEGLVRHANWTEAVLWITALPTDLASEGRWRYWLGRALINSAEGEEAGRDHLAAIAGWNTYYGLLAAQDLALDPAFRPRLPFNDRGAQRSLMNTAAVRRMVELFAVGDTSNAVREWQYALSSLPADLHQHLVELTLAMGWIDQAISGAWKAELKDLVAVRFPTPYLDLYQRNAFEANLPTGLLLAVSRRESAFNPRARSPAGARGLMQLMPATARLIADRIRDKRPHTDELYRPETNIRFGAHHLARLMDRYGRNRALVAAAYNAGEGRVAQWLEDTSGMATPVWIERIPFRETRDYVKNVLFYHYVYRHEVGEPGPVLFTHERTIP
ncbi:MAG: transglycosylase SLT domain-containing protein [Gammaproteobacteria bacterium]|nr:transglycosylase SLT domain-containing protein [Gammaproteobacteria bacterium]MYJ76125.1 transglycosylase SLT domain-containing protein [Gammaproteobacteria bacterium]